MANHLYKIQLKEVNTKKGRFRIRTLYKNKHGKIIYNVKEDEYEDNPNWL